MRGRVVVGTVSGGRGMDLPGLIAGFHHRFPEVAVSLVEDGSDALLQRLHDSALNLAWIGRSTAALPSGVLTRTVVDERLCAVVAHSHPLAGRRSVRTAELARHPLICLPAGTGSRDALEAGARTAGVRLPVAFETAEPLLTAELARHGLGIGVVPASAAEHLRDRLTCCPSWRRCCARAWNWPGWAGPVGRCAADRPPAPWSPTRATSSTRPPTDPSRRRRRKISESGNRIRGRQEERVAEFVAADPGRTLGHHARAVAVPPPGAAAAPGQQADPVRRRRAERAGQGLGRRRRALGADVPRRLRGRPAQPGRADPLRGAQRARRRAGRAHLRGLARPRGADARARHRPVHRRRAPPGRRVRPARRVSFSHRTRLHEPARARSTSPASRCTRPTATSRTRSWSPAGTPRSTPSRSPTSSTPPCSATASRPSARSPTSSATGRPTARTRERACCCAWPRTGGVYVPRFYDVTYLPDGRIEAVDAQPAGVPVRVSKHTVMDLDEWPYPKKPLVPLAETVHERMSVEIFRGCTRGCRFCQAGMITRPVRERSITGIGEMVDAGPGRHRLRGGRPAVAVQRRPLRDRRRSPSSWPTATRTTKVVAVAAVDPGRRVQHRPGQRVLPQRPPLRPDLRPRGRLASGCAGSSTRWSPRRT